MRIAFVADFFTNELSGGAENNDSVLIRHLLDNSYDVRCIRSFDFNEQALKENDFFIISNFTFLEEKYKSLLKDKRYIIYEHDHKYVKSRDVSKYPNFDIPQNDLLNVDFYKNAIAVVVLSKICKQIIDKNLKIDSVYNIGCSLWTDKSLDLIDSLSNNSKNDKFAVINYSNPNKNTSLASGYCLEKNIDFDLIGPFEHSELLSRMSNYKGLVFFPGVLETFSRISAEAKMLNCKLITKPKMLGFASETIFTLSGSELIQDIRKRKNKALELFVSLI